MDVFLMIASMLGGLALFLYGMNVMSDTLPNIVFSLTRSCKNGILL